MTRCHPSDSHYYTPKPRPAQIWGLAAGLKCIIANTLPFHSNKVELDDGKYIESMLAVLVAMRCMRCSNDTEAVNESCRRTICYGSITAVVTSKLAVHRSDDTQKRERDSCQLI